MEVEKHNNYKSKRIGCNFYIQFNRIKLIDGIFYYKFSEAESNLIHNNHYLIKKGCLTN